MSRCCCGGCDDECITLSGVWGTNPGGYLFGTCIRALIWKNLSWTPGGLSFNEWAGGIMNPDIVLRVASRESGPGHSRRCRRYPEKYNLFPVVSRCWDYNPCTGIGNLSWPGYSSGDENMFFTQEARSQLNRCGAARLVAGMLVGMNCTADETGRAQATTYSADCCSISGRTYQYPTYSNYRLATVDWALTIFSPTEEEEAEIDDAVIPPQIIFTNPC